jgi:arginine repressor
MKKENMGVRNTINTRGSDGCKGSGAGKFIVKWGKEGISTGKPISDKRKEVLLNMVAEKAAKGNCFHLHTFPAETRFLIHALDNVHINVFAANFDDTGKDWLIIAADEATAKREANRI